MTDLIFPGFLAAGGLVFFSFEHATIAGKMVLAAARGWIDFQLVGHDHEAARGPVCAETNRRVSARRFGRTASLCACSKSNARFPGRAVFQCLSRRLSGADVSISSARRKSTKPFVRRLEIADKIAPAQMHAVNAAMERAVGEAALKLESQMILLATAVSGAPFLGLLRHGLGRDGHFHRCGWKRARRTWRRWPPGFPAR